MSIRFTLKFTDAGPCEDDLIVSAHHVDTTGGWFEHPIRDHKLRVDHPEHLLAHVALGFVVHRGNRNMLTLSITHDDPGMAHGLEVVCISPEPGESLLPGAEVPAPAFVDRFVIKPGGREVFPVFCSHVRIREVLMSEVPHAEGN
ncbi:hypothetical protein [Zoogloea sp.]|uniref:hypothetical protein n=1 Tax=Zoogloea sp. TaxID=49181 RepID=UPI0035AF3850